MTVFLTIFRRFLTTFRRFSKIVLKARRTFPNIFREFPKILPKMSEDFRRLSRKTRRCFDDTPTNLSTIKETNLISIKSSISSHVRTLYRFCQFVTTRYTTDFYIIKELYLLVHGRWNYSKKLTEDVRTSFA